MTNVLKQAINCDDRNRAASIIMEALGIETDELANFCALALGTEATRSRHRPLAPCGGAIRRLM